MNEIADMLALSSGRECTLYRIRRDMIPDYYLLSFPRDLGEPSPADLSEMLVRGMTRARSLALDRVGDPGAYSVLYSGYSARREHGWIRILRRPICGWISFASTHRLAARIVCSNGARAAHSTR
jgi:hypothetical protein